MSTVFVNIGLSLDGYMAPEGMAIEHWDEPEYKDWGAKWGALMAWILDLQYFRENLQLGTGGETGPINDMLRNTTERIGANIMGKRMFDAGERGWPRRPRSTLRCTCLPTKNANPGSGRAGRLFTSSTTARRAPLNGPGSLRAVAISASPAART